MTITKKIMSLAMVTVLVLNGCADLDVGNTNAPDQSRALAKPGDVESLIKSTFLSFWQGIHVTGGSFNPGVMADANTSSWGNYGMRELSSEPRAAANNSPAWNYAYALEQPWYYWYGAISAAKDGLASLKSGQEGGKNFLADANADKRAEIFAKFIMGASNAMVAVYYDKGFYVDESTDFSGELDLSTYDAHMASAITALKGVISDAEANASIAIPEDWMQIAGLTLGDLAKITHGLIARWTAGVARTAQERGAVDWAAVKSHASQGKPMSPVGDGEYWWSRTQYYCGVSASWGRADYKLIGPAATDNGYTNWLGDGSDATIAGRKAYVNYTDDKRITSGKVSGLKDKAGKLLSTQCAHYSVDNDSTSITYGDTTWSHAFDQARGSYAKNEYRTRLIASRGTYHQTYYTWDRNRDYAVDAGLQGPMHDLLQAELDLLQAEAELRVGTAAAAATLINKTRVVNGGLTAATAAKAGASTDQPNALDSSSLWSMLKYEAMLENTLIHPFTGYMNRRGWGDLVKGTPTHLAIPGKELEILLLENYTFGGQADAGKPGTAGRISNKGFRARGFDIEFEKVTPLIDADLH